MNKSKKSQTSQYYWKPLSQTHFEIYQLDLGKEPGSQLTGPLFDLSGRCAFPWREEVTLEAGPSLRSPRKGMIKKAFDEGQWILYSKSTDTFRRVAEVTTTVNPPKTKSQPKTNQKESKMSKINIPAEHQAELALIHDCYKLKPKQLMMNELKWKFLVRSAIRGKNIMMTGPAGCGKTRAAKALVAGLQRPDFYFNLGATQDPRSTLIGNTQFKEGTGTYFAESLFVKAIQTENAIILLDELSRAHPEAWNILMTVLDQGQRYLRIDEEDGTRTIKVADGVTFVATANIGNEYTSTRVMDRALMDRFTVIEMDVLTKDEELALLTMLYPNVPAERLEPIAEIVEVTRNEIKLEASRLGSAVSTRASVEMASLLYDGFTLHEAAEVVIFPMYPEDGGADSERTFVKQLVQKYVDDHTTDNLFNTEDMAAAEADSDNDW